MKKLIFAMIAGVSIMGAAQAEGGYVGAGVTSTKQAAGNGDYKASGKLFGGVEVDKTWGVEAGYTDFRSTDYTVGTGALAPRWSTKGHAIYVAGKGTMPLNDQFSLFGKLGVTSVKTEATIAGSGVPVISTLSDTKTGAYAALGAQYNLSKQVALTAEYERYGKSRSYGAKPDAFTVAARYSF
jgi:opacity protein-like surface antigen